MMSIILVMIRTPTSLTEVKYIINMKILLSECVHSHFQLVLALTCMLMMFMIYIRSSYVVKLKLPICKSCGYYESYCENVMWVINSTCYYVLVEMYTDSHNVYRDTCTCVHMIFMIYTSYWCVVKLKRSLYRHFGRYAPFNMTWVRVTACLWHFSSMVTRALTLSWPQCTQPWWWLLAYGLEVNSSCIDASYATASQSGKLDGLLRSCKLVMCINSTLTCYYCKHELRFLMNLYLLSTNMYMSMRVFNVLCKVSNRVFVRCCVYYFCIYSYSHIQLTTALNCMLKMCILYIPPRYVENLKQHICKLFCYYETFCVASIWDNSYTCNQDLMEFHTFSQNTRSYISTSVLMIFMTYTSSSCVVKLKPFLLRPTSRYANIDINWSQVTTCLCACVSMETCTLALICSLCIQLWWRHLTDDTEVNNLCARLSHIAASHLGRSSTLLCRHILVMSISTASACYYVYTYRIFMVLYLFFTNMYMFVCVYCALSKPLNMVFFRLCVYYSNNTYILLTHYYCGGVYCMYYRVCKFEMLLLNTER